MLGYLLTSWIAIVDMILSYDVMFRNFCFSVDHYTPHFLLLLILLDLELSKFRADS